MSSDSGMPRMKRDIPAHFWAYGLVSLVLGPDISHIYTVQLG